MSTWYLEGNFGTDKVISKQALRDFPQTIGRNTDLAYAVQSPGVSKHHARLEERDGALWIVDLQSTNGTYVNRQLLDDTTCLYHGDVIHLGEAEFRVIDQGHLDSSLGLEEAPKNDATVLLSLAELSEHFPSGVHELEELIATKAVAMEFQPIVQGPNLETVGYEILGRGNFPNLARSPYELFKIAESTGLEVELSDLMRNTGVDIAVEYDLQGDIFVNTHPHEMKNPDQLLASLHQLRQRHPDLPLVFEVHEECVMDVDSLRAFKNELKRMSIRFAFDDFGVGQFRLMELTEAKPDIIKFDKILIAGIDKADEGRINLLRHLKQIASELSIQTLAECVENEAEYLVCKDLGFDLYQGYFFARPAPASTYRTE